MQINRNLTEKEIELLSLTEESIAARAFCVKTETLQLWRTLGLKHSMINGTVFYNIEEVAIFMRTSIDLLNKKTPEHLLQQRWGKWLLVSLDDFKFLLPKCYKKAILKKNDKLKAKPSSPRA